MDAFCEEYASKLDNYLNNGGSVEDVLSLAREIASFVSKSMEELQLLRKDNHFKNKESANSYFGEVYDLSVLLSRAIGAASSGNVAKGSRQEQLIFDMLNLSLVVEKNGYKEGKISIERKTEIGSETFTDYQYESFLSEHVHYHEEKYRYYQKLKSKYSSNEIEKIDADIHETKEKIRIYNEVFDNYLSTPKMKEAYYGKKTKQFWIVFITCAVISVVTLFALVAIGRSNRLLLFIFGTVLVVANIAGLISRFIGYKVEKKEKEKRKEIVTQLPDDLKLLYDENKKNQLRVKMLEDEKRRKK